MRAAIKPSEELGDEQLMLLKSVGEFLEREYPRTRMRGLVSGDRGIAEELRGKAASQGLLGMLYPPEYGGLGLGMTDVALVCELYGMYLAPGELLSSPFLSGLVISIGGTEEQKQEFLGGIAEGKCAVAPALTEDLQLPADGSPRLVYREAGDGYEVSGEGAILLDGERAGYLLLPAYREDGGEMRLFIARRSDPSLKLEEKECLDLTRRPHLLRVENMMIDGGHAIRGGEEALRRVEPYILTATSAEAVGIMQRVLDMTLDHLSGREAFGRPLSSFQALKHRAADLLILLEKARSLTRGAARALDEGGGGVEANLASLAAKAHSGPASIKTTLEAIQLHGGVGFTWESDLHLYLRRAKLDDALFLDSHRAKKRIASILLGGPPT